MTTSWWSSWGPQIHALLSGSRWVLALWRLVLLSSWGPLGWLTSSRVGLVNFWLVLSAGSGPGDSLAVPVLLRLLLEMLISPETFWSIRGIFCPSLEKKKRQHFLHYTQEPKKGLRMLAQFFSLLHCHFHSGSSPKEARQNLSKSSFPEIQPRGEKLDAFLTSGFTSSANSYPSPPGWKGEVGIHNFHSCSRNFPYVSSHPLLRLKIYSLLQ